MFKPQMYYTNESTKEQCQAKGSLCNTRVLPSQTIWEKET